MITLVDTLTCCPKLATIIMSPHLFENTMLDIAIPSVCYSVYLSLCPRHFRIASKRLDTSFKFFHQRTSLTDFLETFSLVEI